MSDLSLVLEDSLYTQQRTIPLQSQEWDVGLRLLNTQFTWVYNIWRLKSMKSFFSGNVVITEQFSGITNARNLFWCDHWPRTFPTHSLMMTKPLPLSVWLTMSLTISQRMTTPISFFLFNKTSPQKCSMQYICYSKNNRQKHRLSLVQSVTFASQFATYLSLNQITEELQNQVSIDNSVI